MMHSNTITNKNKNKSKTKTKTTQAQSSLKYYFNVLGKEVKSEQKDEIVYTFEGEADKKPYISPQDGRMQIPCTTNFRIVKPMISLATPKLFFTSKGMEEDQKERKQTQQV